MFSVWVGRWVVGACTWGEGVLRLICCLVVFFQFKKSSFSRVELASIQYSTKEENKEDWRERWWWRRNQYSLKKDHSYSRAIFKQIERKRIETYTSTPHTHAIKKKTNNQTKGKENVFLVFLLVEHLQSGGINASARDHRLGWTQKKN